MRVGIIGARRRANGIGEYVARELQRAGAEVTAIVGTQAETVSQTCDHLRLRFGLSVAGYLDVDEMIADQRLDAVAICSPRRFHREHLAACLAGSVHVLCEKPLVWDDAADANIGDTVASARRLVEGFASTGRLLMLNQQWPYTLPTFDRCWPGVRTPGKPIRRLDMLMCPSERGLGMIPNALPHVVSLLLAMTPAGGELERIEVDQPADDGLDLQFDYVHAEGITTTSVRLRQVLDHPRPFLLGIDGRLACRRIRREDYSMRLEALSGDAAEIDWWPGQPECVGGSVVRSEPLPDPLALLARDFVKRVECGATTHSINPMIVENVHLVGALYAAAQTRLESLRNPISPPARLSNWSVGIGSAGVSDSGFPRVSTQ